MIDWAKNFFQENDVNNVPLDILKSVIEILPPGPIFLLLMIIFQHLGEKVAH